jgi:23S rRNA pseudouridine2605 synthase
MSTRPGSAPARKKPATTLIRINRYLGMCGVSSRRKAEQLVLDGKVKVNNQVIDDLATRVDPDRDRVFVEGKQVVRVHDYQYLVLNKPKDTITTLSDERGRPTVMGLVRTRDRVFPVGRLDRNTTGVLLLTNDGELAHRLMHPKFQIPKTYRVRCDRAVARGDLEKLARGVELNDGFAAASEVFILPSTKGREVGITIHEGRNRQVRRMFEALEYGVERLDRVAYGPVTTEGLPRGRTRPLTSRELRSLRDLAGIAADSHP